MFEKMMARTFIELPEFSKNWKSLGLNDEDLRRLQRMLMESPEAFPIVEGTGGLRKARFAFAGKGKSGSVRVCYVDFVFSNEIYLITAYEKSKKENLSQREKNMIKSQIQLLKKHLVS